MTKPTFQSLADVDKELSSVQSQQQFFRHLVTQKLLHLSQKNTDEFRALAADISIKQYELFFRTIRLETIEKLTELLDLAKTKKPDAILNLLLEGMMRMAVSDTEKADRVEEEIRNLITANEDLFLSRKGEL